MVPTCKLYIIVAVIADDNAATAAVFRAEFVIQRQPDTFLGRVGTLYSWWRRLMSINFASILSARHALQHCLKSPNYARMRLFCTTAVANEGPSKLTDPGTLKDFLHTVVGQMLPCQPFCWAHYAEYIYLCGSQILARGPLSVAEFMRHVRGLSCPVAVRLALAPPPVAISCCITSTFIL